MPELLADLNTGHNIVATVFEECRAMYRANGPVEMRLVGEVEFVAGIAAAIRFTCPKCSRKTDATVVLDEPDWFDDDLNSKAFRGKATVTCPACKTLFPASSSLQGDQLDAVTLDDFPETDINIVQQPGFIDPDDYDFPDDYPEEPYQIFKDSYNHTRELLTEHGQEHGDYLLNRMVFAQQVASLEAYLGDTIRKAMHWDET